HWKHNPFTEEIPILNYQDDRSIVCRHYPNESTDTPTWIWIKHPPLIKQLKQIESQLISNLMHIYAKKARAIYLKNKVTKLASEYLDNHQTYFSLGYQKWKKWMIIKNLFIPSQNKKDPSLPDILKTKKGYPMLWPFRAWDIIVLSHLAELVDAYPAHQKIYYHDLFIALTEKYGLSKQYRESLKEFKELNTSTAIFGSLIDEDRIIQCTLSTFDSLITEGSIIKDALFPFAKKHIISIGNNHLIRMGSLILALDI
ncbi:hypothetical protein ABLA85_16335, partial [Xenorhabdus sp. SGI246]